MSDAKTIWNDDPLSETAAILRHGFYGQGDQASDQARDQGRRARRRRERTRQRPTHYKVVCISLYTRDIEALEATLAELKRRGYTKANKSQLIRYALSQLDIDKLPPPHP
jgi:hypothetical protein